MIWPGAVSSPGVAAANVKAEPARSPRMREMTPASPMQMPTTLELWLSSTFSRKRIKVRLSESDCAVGTIFMNSGANASIRARIASSPLVALKSWWLMISAAPVARIFARVAAGSFSADSSSTSINWKPDSDAFNKISAASIFDPAKRPPFTLQRHVAMAVAAPFAKRNCLKTGSALAGLPR